jgi:para-nitrobenzyl esterase
LNLNVYVAQNATAESKLPVMVFFHGGSFAEGSDQGPFAMYDGSYIAGTKPVIVVTANYRLGALGWIAVGS